MCVNKVVVGFRVPLNVDLQVPPVVCIYELRQSASSIILFVSEGMQK